MVRAIKYNKYPSTLSCEEAGDPICQLSAVYRTQGQKHTPVETIILLQGGRSATVAREAMAVVGKGGDR